MPSMRRILLMGYFGAGNFGDDALLADWLLAHSDWLDEQGLVCDVLARGEQPLCPFVEAERLGQHIGRAVGQREALTLPLADYAALVAPGGSLLQDTTSQRSLLYYLLLIRHFTKARKPVFLLHQGIGPILSWLGNWFAVQLLSRTALLSLRDEQSLAWAERQPLLASHPGLLLSADPIMAARFEAVDTPLPASPYALIVPRPTGDLPHRGDRTTEAQALAAVCAELAQCGLTPVLLPLHPEQDAALCTAIADICPAASIAPVSTPLGNHIWTLFSHAGLVVSYRLHGLVAAAACGVPGYGIAYDPKVSALCEQLGLRWCFPAEVHEAEALGTLRMLVLTLDTARERLAPQVDAARGRVAASRARFRELFAQFSTPGG